MNNNLLSLPQAVCYLFDKKQATLTWVYEENIRSNSKEFELFNSLFLESDNQYSKEKIDSFKKNHIRIDHLLNSLEAFMKPSASKGDAVNKKIKAINLTLFIFGANKTNKFLSLEDANRFSLYTKYLHDKTSADILSKNEFFAELGIKKDREKKIIETYNLTPLFNTSKENFYLRKDLNSLLDKQKKMLLDIHENYYVDNQLKNLDNVPTIFFKEVIPYKEDFPILCNVKTDFYDYSWTQKIVSKVNVDLVLNNLNEQYTEKTKNSMININKIDSQKLNSIFENNKDDPYKCYLLFCDALNISFNDNIDFTKFHWNNFVRKKLYSSIQKDTTLRNLISMLAYSCKTLSSIIQNKEIIHLSTEHLSSFLFNSNVPLGRQTILYSFLFNLSSLCKNEGFKNLSFDIKKIENPKHKIGRVDKEIYDVNTFSDLINYNSSLDFHLNHSIDDALLQINKPSDSLCYANMWLYSNILLNNAWRHNDVLTFPSLPFELIDSIELENIHSSYLSENEINNIINFYYNQNFIHSKTGQKRFFMVSKELRNSFAYSVLVSSVIKKNISFSSDFAFSFPKESYVYSKYHDNFFKHFLDKYPNFSFRSLKTNRTLESYMLSVVKSKTNKNPVELIKFMRNHADIDITNIYIDIPQEKIDLITSQLFNLGNFGFVYDSISTILNHEESADRDERLNNALASKDFFNSLEHVESVSKLLNSLTGERDIVKDLLLEAPIEEIQEKYTLLNLGLLSSKSCDFQCLVGEEQCPFSSADCSKCTLSIPNIYTLSSVNNRIQSKLDDFSSSFSKTTLPAERSRLANQLFIEKELLSSAIERFGRDTVDSFIDGGFESLNKRWASLPSFKEYISLNERGQ